MGKAARSRSKDAERRVCRSLGGDRSTSPAQTSAGASSADCTDDVPEYCEVKTRADPSVHRELMELHKQARRMGRQPIIVYDAEDGPTWMAMWHKDTYLEHSDREDGGCTIGLSDLLTSPLFLVGHRVGSRLPCRSLVEETIQRASEEHRPPLAVMLRKGSSKYVALVPVER